MIHRLTIRRDERGAGTLEYVGVTVVAAILILALIVSFNAFGYRDRLSQALCEVSNAFDGGTGNCGPTGTGRSEADYVPPESCVVESDGKGGRGSIAAAAFVEGGYSWTIEQLGDGQFRLTRNADLGGGAAVGIGANVTGTGDGQNYGIAAKAEASARLSAAGSDVYFAATREEAEQILSASNADTAKDAIVDDDWFLRDWVNSWTNASELEDREPESTFVGVDGEISAEAQATLVTADAEADVNGATLQGTWEHSDGTTTDVMTLGSEGSAAARVLGQDQETGEWEEGYAEAGYEGQVTLEIDRDDDGNPVAMRAVRLGMGHADASASNAYASEDDQRETPTYTETTWQIPLETTEQRTAAGKLLLGVGAHVDGVTDEIDPWDVSTLNYGKTWSDIEDLAKRDGFAWTQEYELDETTHGGVFDAQFLAKVGASGEYTEMQRRATHYTYWNGDEYVERSGCIY